MANLNKVLLMGNLTRDPELRYTPKGTQVVEIGLAINRRYVVDNEVKEEVTFVDITFWGRQAEVITQYCKKGRGLFVEGRLQLDSWDDRTTGKKVYKLRVVGDNFQFVGPREGGGDGGGTQAPRAASAPHPSARPAGEGNSGNEAPPGGLAEEDDQIPF